MTDWAQTMMPYWILAYAIMTLVTARLVWTGWARRKVAPESMSLFFAIYLGVMWPVTIFLVAIVRVQDWIRREHREP